MNLKSLLVKSIKDIAECVERPDLFHSYYSTTPQSMAQMAKDAAAAIDRFPEWMDKPAMAGRYLVILGGKGAFYMFTGDQQCVPLPMDYGLTAQPATVDGLRGAKWYGPIPCAP